MHLTLFHVLGTQNKKDGLFSLHSGKNRQTKHQFMSSLPGGGKC